MSNVILSTPNSSNTNVATQASTSKGATPPVIQSTQATKPSEASLKKNKNTMSWTQVGLRGLYGAAACGIYVSGHRAIFQKPLLPKDLAVVMGTCGLKAMAMSTAIKAIRGGYRNFMPGTTNQLPKDITEAGLVDAIETGVSFFQDKAMAHDVDALKRLGLSAAKSYPNNFMDTKSYSNFVDWYAGKDKLPENPSDKDTADFKQRKESFGNYVITPLAALVTAIPATYLNNEPLTPTNFAKTVALRVASVKLWRKAMDLAKKHSGDDKSENAKLVTSVPTKADKVKDIVVAPITDKVKDIVVAPITDKVKDIVVAPITDKPVYPLTGKTS